MSLEYGINDGYCGETIGITVETGNDIIVTRSVHGGHGKNVTSGNRNFHTFWKGFYATKSVISEVLQPFGNLAFGQQKEWNFDHEKPSISEGGNHT